MNATQTGTAATDAPRLTRTGSVSHPTRSIPAPGSSGAGQSHPAEIQPDTETSSPSSGLEFPSKRRKSSSKPPVSAIGVFALAVALTGLAVRYLALTQGWIKTDNAYLSAHIHTISPRVAGTVAEVLVDDHQTVLAGALLARLDSRDFEIRRAQALAQLSAARAQVLEAEARIAQARAQVSREQARATKAQLDLARAATLFEAGSGAISKQEFDSAHSESDAAQAAFQGAQSALDSAAALAAAAKAQEEAANAGLKDADLQLSYTEVRAPAAGRIGRRNLENGNRVQPGQALFALVEPELWVTANFKETQLASIKPGQSVRVRVDAFPGRTFKGTVASLSPASGSEFALLPPDNATGNFTRIVQRVPVKILFETASFADNGARLVAGMSALVEVHVRE